MSYIPSNAEWYVAGIVEEIRDQGDVRSVVHRNLVLIKAQLPDEAYTKACDLGRESEIAYQNPSGQEVSIRFRGLSYLDVVHDKLEHGAELLYTESIGMPEGEMVKLVRPKEELGAFAAIEASKGPDYSSSEVITEAMKLSTTRIGH